MKPVTANLTRVSLVPVEYFTPTHASKVKRRLGSDGWLRVAKGPVVAAIQELCDVSAELYEPPGLRDDSAVSLVVFMGSSACLVRVARTRNWPITDDSVRNQCAERRGLHIDALQKPIEFFGGATCLLAPNDDTWPTKVNYVFTYYIAGCARQLPQNAIDTVKILAEPSLADIDDMLSTDAASKPAPTLGLGKKSASRLASLLDTDLGDGRQVFITWESIALH